MANGRLSELLLVKTDLIDGGKLVTTIYEIGKNEGIARMSIISADKKYKILSSHTIHYPYLPKSNEGTISELSLSLNSGGRA